MKAPRTFDGLLRLLVSIDGTDLFVSAGAEPSMTVNGEMRSLRDEPLSNEDVASMVAPFLAGAPTFASSPDLDVSHTIPDLGRFRVNIFRQRGRLGLVARRVQTIVPTLKDFHLPKIIGRFAKLHHGLVLVSGPTGSGKSTTLAAMIDHRNQTTQGHIVTLEDPIEFVHENAGCVINQREIGTDTTSFASGLRSAMRQAPNVVLIGEIRDSETARAALRMGETGHLVLATLHATNCVQTLERLVNLFPDSSRPQVLAVLSLELGGIVAQRLLRRRDSEERIAAIEIMVPTPRIRDLVATGALDELRAAIQDGSRRNGMLSLEDSLLDLVVSGKVSSREALAHADSPSDLRLRLQNEARKRGHATDDGAPQLRLV